MRLYAGRESRTEGAPDLRMPGDMDLIEALAAQIADEYYGGDMELSRQVAQQIYDEEVKYRRAESDRQQRVAAARSGKRRNDRAAARGVVPESLPADEYGSVSGRTVQEANRPLEDQEAALMQEQDLADEQARGLREGKRAWGAEQAYQYAQENGLGVTPSRTGKTDLDYLREQQGHQGFLRTGRGEMIPMGPAPTPESLESRRVFDEWANETPGTERQARYSPAAYAQWREAQAEGVRQRAQEEMAKYGGADPSKWTDEQKDARAARAASEDRVADSDTQRELKIARLAQRAGVSREKAREMMDSGRAAFMVGRPAGKPLTAAERRLESQKLRDMGNTRQDALREADMAARQQALREQRMLLAPGGRGVVNAINQLPDGWREIAMLDRLTDGRRGGATPLDVAGQQMTNALPVVRSAVAGMMQDMDPAAAASRRMQEQIALANMAPEQRAALSIQLGQPMGTGYSAAHVGARFNYWMRNLGWRPGDLRDQNFRMEMESLGYTPAQIDAWIDARLAADGPPASPAPAPPPGGGAAAPPPTPPASGSVPPPGWGR